LEAARAAQTSIGVDHVLVNPNDPDDANGGL